MYAQVLVCLKPSEMAYIKSILKKRTYVQSVWYTGRNGNYSYMYCFDIRNQADLFKLALFSPNQIIVAADVEHHNKYLKYIDSELMIRYLENDSQETKAAKLHRLFSHARALSARLTDLHNQVFEHKSIPLTRYTKRQFAKLHKQLGIVSSVLAKYSSRHWRPELQPEPKVPAPRRVIVAGSTWTIS